MTAEVFGENYTGEEEIVFSPNEHFLNHQGGNQDEGKITGNVLTAPGARVGEKSFPYLIMYRPVCEQGENFSCPVRTVINGLSYCLLCSAV